MCKFMGKELSENAPHDYSEREGEKHAIPYP